MSLIPYRTYDHSDADSEWGLHRGISEWWYATGVVQSRTGRRFSFQFTVISARLGALVRPRILMLALSELEARRHCYTQKPSLSGRELRVDSRTVRWGDRARARKTDQGILLHARADAFSFAFQLGYGNGAVWHCDRGVLQMGLPGPKETTVYFSYPNMPTRGTLTVDGEELEVEGASWFDKQGGPFSLTQRGTHWEWFSLRFTDGERIMLFSFPQSHSQDGTYIRSDGRARRLTSYTITPTAFTTANGMRFSAGWEIAIPGVKDEQYRVTPAMEGQLNFAYFEQLARVQRVDGAQVGLCFVELLPGVLNERFRTTDMLRTIAA